MEDVSSKGNKTGRRQNVVVVARVENMTPLVAASNRRIPTLSTRLSDILNIVAQVSAIQLILNLRECACDSDTGVVDVLSPSKDGRRVRIRVPISEIELLKTENGTQ